jgi:hypothetical protein
VGLIGTVLALAFVVVAGLGGTLVVVRAVQWRLIESDPPRLDRWQELDDVSSGLLTALVTIGVAIAVGLAFWSVRLAQNTRWFGVDRAPDPGLAAGGWFVPFANVVIEGSVLQRIWRASDPTTTPGDGRRGRASPLPVVWMIATAVAFTSWFGASQREAPEQCASASAVVQPLIGDDFCTREWTVEAARSHRRSDLAVAIAVTSAALLGAAATGLLTRRHDAKLTRLQRAGLVPLPWALPPQWSSSSAGPGPGATGWLAPSTPPPAPPAAPRPTVAAPWWASQPPARLEPLARCLVGSFAFIAVMAVLQLVAVIQELWAVTADPPDTDRWESLQDRIGGFVLVQILMAVAVGALMAAWSVRARRNVERAGLMPGPLFPPAFAGWMWAIPFANLPLGIAFLSELWSGAVPPAPDAPPTHRSSSALPVLWLSTTIVGLTLAGIHAFTDASTPAAAASADRVAIGVVALLIVAAVLGAVTMWRLSRALDRLFAGGGRSRPAHDAPSLRDVWPT